MFRPQSRPLYILVLIVFIDLLGYSLIFPLLPFYAVAFGASPAVIGLLLAVYAAAHLVATPILGRLSDRVGRRPVLLVSLVGTLVSFVIIGLATALWLLFVARILDGLSTVISAAQAYISDVTAPQERARGLGALGAAFGLGFIIGPAIGGSLSGLGLAVPAFAAAALAGLALALLYLFLPESLTPERRRALADGNTSAYGLSFLRQALRRPQVSTLLEIRFFSGMAIALFQSIFALYALLRFGATPQTVGYILTYVGVLVVLMQGVAIGWLAARIDERWLVVAALLLLALGLLGWALAPSLAILLVALAPLSLSFGALNTVLNSMLSKSVPPEQFGGILGLSASVFSLAQLIAPAAGGLLLGALGTASPGLLGAGIVVPLIPFACRRLLRRPSP